MNTGAPDSTYTNGVKKVNKAANVRSLSLISHHRRIKFDLVTDNEDSYVKQST